MPRTGNNIYKRQDGRWEGRYPKGRSDNGKIIYGYIYATTCTEVKRRLNAANRENRESLRKTTTAMCLAEIAEQWLSVVALTVKASTLDGYDTAVKLHILPAFGTSDIKTLNTATISAFAQNKLQNGRLDGCGGLAPKTVRDILCVLKGIMDFAVREKYIDDHVSITYPKQQQKSMRVLSLAEQSALQKILLENPTIYNVGILLCLYTGLRVGEVCGLCWDDFSPGLDKLSVRRSVRRIKSKDGERKTKIIVDTPKSKSSVRDVPVPQFIAPVLLTFIREGDTYFISSMESQLTEPRMMQNHFKRVIKAAGIEKANFHCLRHTFSTLCIEAGVDIKSLSEMLGHANVNITLNRYVHSSFDQKRESINKLERYLGLHEDTPSEAAVIP